MVVAAILVAMFPHQLPSQAVKELAASIVDLARGVTIVEPVDLQLPRTGVLFQSVMYWPYRDGVLFVMYSALSHPLIIISASSLHPFV
jgi:hypothetical protein